MLQLDQGMIGPGNVSRAAGAGAEASCRRHHGPDHLRVLAHPEIIVRAPDHHLAPTIRRVPDGVRETTSDALKIREDAIALLIPQPAQGGGKKRIIVHASLLDCCDWAHFALNLESCARARDPTNGGSGQQRRDATLFAVSNMAFALGSASSKCSYKDLNGQRMIDHIAAEIWIVPVRLGTLVCSPRAGQQRIAARLCRRNPIVFPASPRVPVYRVEEFALNPRRASTEANPNLGDVGVVSPSGAENGEGTIGFESLIHAGARDLRFQFHLRERPADRCSLGIIPIAVVGSLPVALKRLGGRNDVGQPLYRG